MDLPVHFFSAHDRKCIHILVMISIPAKLSTKSVAPSKSCITYIPFLTILSLVKTAVRVKGQVADVMAKP